MQGGQVGLAIVIDDDDANVEAGRPSGSEHAAKGVRQQLRASERRDEQIATSSECDSTQF